MKGHCTDDGEIDALWRSLHRHVRSRTRHEDLAADVVQEAWLRTLANPPPRRTDLKGWLRVVATRLMWETARAHRNRLEREHWVAREELVPGADEEIERRDDGVVRLLEDLREPYREVVRLRYLEDVDVAEIATRLGRSEGTIRSQVKRGLDRLRARLVSSDEARGRARRTRLPLFAWFGFRRERGPQAESHDRSVAWTALPMGALVVGAWLLALSVTTPRGVEAPFEPLVAAPRHEAARASVALQGGADAAPVRELAAAQPADAAIESAFASTSAAAERAALELAGRVIFRIRGTAIADAIVFASDEQETRRVASSDADGRFTARIERFPVWVWAEHADYAPTHRQRVDRGFAASGEAFVLDSPRAGRCSGIVVDPAGLPVAGAEVCAHDANEAREARGALALIEIPAPPTTVRTDANGRFSVPARGTTRVLFDVRAPGHLARTTYADSRSSATRIELVRDAAGPTSSRVEDALGPAMPVREESGNRGDSFDDLRLRGAPSADALACGPASAFLHGQLVRFDRVGGPELEVRVVGATLERPVRIPVDEQGVFVVGPLPPGGYGLFVEGGGVHGAWFARRVDLAGGQQLDLGPLLLPLPGSLHARIGGAAVPDDASAATVILRSNGVAIRFHFRTGGTGIEFDGERDTVSIREVWPGEYELLVAGPTIVARPARAVVLEGRTTDVDWEVAAACQTFAQVLSPRKLLPEETLEVWLRSPAGVAAPGRVGALSRDDVDCVLAFNCGIPDDVERIEVRSSHGLYGELELAHVPKVQGRRVQISLEER